MVKNQTTDERMQAKVKCQPALGKTKYGWRFTVCVFLVLTLKTMERLKHMKIVFRISSSSYDVYRIVRFCSLSCGWRMFPNMNFVIHRSSITTMFEEKRNHSCIFTNDLIKKNFDLSNKPRIYTILLLLNLVFK